MRTPLEPWCARKVGVPAAELTRQALERYQLERLQGTVAWARARSPFYRGRLGDLDLDLSSLDDLVRLPFTTPDDVRSDGRRLVCVSQDEISRVVTLQSSGTTGASKRLFFTAAEQGDIVDFFAAGMATLVERGDRVVVFLPGPTSGTVAALLAEALARLEVTAIQHGFVRDLAEAAATLRGDRPTAIVALPVHALALARWTSATAPSTIRLRSALLTADHVPRSLARQVEAAFSCAVFEHYGMTEMGLGGGVECAAHGGYHLREADLLFEVVDRDSGAPVPAGTSGEVVVTTLTRRAMPLIRYRTGDLAHLIAAPCRCGSVIRRLARVRGRAAAPTFGGVTLCDLDEIIFGCPSVVDFAGTIDGGALQIDALTLGTGGGAIAGLPPRTRVTYTSIDGRLTSGPAKRMLTARTEIGDGN